VTQSFGYKSSPSYAGGSTGEIGGQVWSSTTPAYYGLITTKTLTDDLWCTGRFRVRNTNYNGGWTTESDVWFG
jgi:hypothetical protein